MGSNMKDVQAVLICDMTSSEREFIDEVEYVLISSLPDDSFFETFDAMARHSPFAIPWLEIAFVFTSTTIATTLLSKLGEDIYNHSKQGIVGAWEKRKQKRKLINDKIKQIEALKSQGVENLKEKEFHQLLKTEDELRDLARKEDGTVDVDEYEGKIGLRKNKRITITINAQNVLVQGRVESDNEEKLFEAIGNAQQMLSDSMEKQEKGLSELLQPSNSYGESTGVKQTPVFQRGLWFEYEYDIEKSHWNFIGVTLYKPGDFSFIEGENDRIIFPHDLVKRKKQ